MSCWMLRRCQRRCLGKYEASPGNFSPPEKLKRDVVIIGGGHNGLVCGAYLAKAGLDTLILERRGQVGGAAVTEEIIPGYKFSRASYLAGLLRPAIIKELELEKHGMKYLSRDPSSFTPSRTATEPYLILGDDPKMNHASIAQFSTSDADRFEAYEDFLSEARELIQPLLDMPLPDLEGGLKQKFDNILTAKTMMRVGLKHSKTLVPFYELFTGSASHLLNRWFENDILKTTLATDAVIGAMVSPSSAGSAYVLLHHVMGEAAGKKGVWSYVEGGMGSISNSIASSAKSHGAEILTDATVDCIVTDDGRATGVRMTDGTFIEAGTVVAGCSPYHTFVELMDEAAGVPKDFVHHIQHTEQACGAFKINCAVSELPEFKCYPNPGRDANIPGDMHKGTVHFETRMSEIEAAYTDAASGKPAERPVVEMTIPSAVDTTLCEKGHVVQLFVQFAPYDVDPQYGTWACPDFKERFVKRVFSIVDEFAPNFSASIIGYDALSPLDLERIFALPKGNIFHGALTLQQLGYARPVPGYSSHRTPLKGLYMGASGTHPGGGVMGAPGRNCSGVILNDLRGV